MENAFALQVSLTMVGLKSAHRLETDLFDSYLRFPHRGRANQTNNLLVGRANVDLHSILSQVPVRNVSRQNSSMGRIASPASMV